MFKIYVSAHTEKENSTPAVVIEDNDEGPPAKKQRYWNVYTHVPVVEPAFFVIKKNWMCMEHLLPGLFEILLNFKFSVRLVKIQEVQLYVSVLCKVGLWFACGPASRFCVLSVRIEFSRSYKKNKLILEYCL